MGIYRNFCLVLTLIFIVSFSSCAIYIDKDLSGKFNVGDEVSISFRIEETLPKQDYVEVHLICDNENRVIYKEFKSFLLKKSYDFSVSTVFLSEGLCHLNILFDGDSKKTNSFEVSSLIDLDVFLNSRVFMPGERVSVSGVARKFSGGDFNYSVGVFLGDFFEKSYGFNQGNFSFDFILPDKIPSGGYQLGLLFEERNLFGNLINSINYNENVSILSKPFKIVIDCFEEFKPEFDLEIGVSLVDQSLNLIENETVIVKIFDLENNLFYDGSVPSGGSFVVNFLGNSTIGGWRISAFYGGLSAVKPIYVLENRQVFVDYVNGSSYLTIKNVGNVLYDGVVEVFLENASGVYSVPLIVELAKGSFKDYMIEDHHGDYNLSVGERTFSNVYITGAVISGGKMVNYVFILVIIVIVILLIFLFFYFKYRFGKSRQDAGNYSNILVSGDKNVKFIHPNKKVINKDSEPKKVFVRGDSSVRETFNKDYKNKYDVDIDKYLGDSDRLNSKVSDIPVVKNVLRGAGRHGSDSRSGSDGGHGSGDGHGPDGGSGFDDRSKKNHSIGGVSQKNLDSFYRFDGESKSANVGGGIAKRRNISQKKVYSIFYRNEDLQDLTEILKKYGLGIYKVGGVRFSLLKSSKNLEMILVNLLKLIVNNTSNSDILLHSVPFEESSKLSRIFGPIRDVLKEGEGILISEDIFSLIENKKDFVFFKSIRSGENIIKLYRLKTLG